METLNHPAGSIHGNSKMNKKSSRWTKEENKRFESALAMFDEKTEDRWYRVAAMVPGKSVSDVIDQYNELVADVSCIEESGSVLDPNGYFMMDMDPSSSFKLDLIQNQRFYYDGCRKRGRSCDHDRKKGIPWTEEEHRRFLLGLEAHGKGDWRNISRNYVISKTPTQVASHAQKYFLRQISNVKDKKRPSIHDITTVNLLSKMPSNDQRQMNMKEKPIDISSNSMVFDSTRHSNRSTGSLFDIATHNSSSHYVANLCASSNSTFSFPSNKYVHG